MPKTLLLFSMLLASALVSANDTYQQMCSACHGKAAEGNPALSAPGLAGLEQAYVERQLTNFKLKRRAGDNRDSLGQQMLAFSSALNEAQITNIAEYLSQLAAPSPKPQLTGETDKGKKIYLSNCAACHGNEAQGNPLLNSPTLLVQGDAYLLRQLKNFKQGIRGANSEDKFGRQMAMMAATLSDEQAMKDVVAYINSLSNNEAGPHIHIYG